MRRPTRKCKANPVYLPPLAVAAIVLVIAAKVQAADAPIPHGTVELIAEDQWITPEHDFSLGLHFQLEQGWHIYWVNPGDSGEPPQAQWSLPPGIITEPLEWPAPQRLGTAPIVDYGYNDSVVLLVPMRASATLASQQTARLGANLRVLVCREVCLPGKARLALTLPVRPQTPAPDTRTKALFAQARRSLPRAAPPSWRFSVTDTKDAFVLTADLGHRVAQATLFPLMESQIDNAAPQKVEATASGFRLTLRKSGQLLKTIERLKGVVVIASDHAYIIDVPVGKAGARRR